MRAVRSLGAVLPVALLGLALATPADAVNRKAWKSYEDGREAIEAGRWSEARDHLREALQRDSEEGRRRTGMTFKEYFPSVYLAQALLELGEREAARSALERARAVEGLGDSERSTLEAVRRRLEQSSKPEPTPPVEPPPEAPAGPSADAQAAQAAFGRGDLASARGLARSALQADPSDALARQVLEQVDLAVAQRVTRAGSEREAGSLDAAERTLEEVRRIDPDNAGAQALLQAVRSDRERARRTLADAEAALEASRLDEAERLARRARETDLSQEGASRELERRVRSARAEARESRGPSAASILAEARAALEGGDLARARQLAQDAASRDASSSGTAAALRQEIARRSEAADHELREARRAVAVGRFDAAREKAAAARSMDSGLGRESRGVASEADEAEQRMAVLRSKIEAHLESGASSAALRVLDDIEKEFPEWPALEELRPLVEGSDVLVHGVRSFFRGELAASIESLEAARRSQSDRADVLAVLAAAHASRGILDDEGDGDGSDDMSRAEELFRQAVERDPKIALDPRYFSPRVIEILDRVRKATAGG